MQTLYRNDENQQSKLFGDDSRLNTQAEKIQKLFSKQQKKMNRRRLVSCHTTSPLNDWKETENYLCVALHVKNDFYFVVSFETLRVLVLENNFVGKEKKKSKRTKKSSLAKFCVYDDGLSEQVSANFAGLLASAIDGQCLKWKWLLPSQIRAKFGVDWDKRNRVINLIRLRRNWLRCQSFSTLINITHWMECQQSSPHTKKTRACVCYHKRSRTSHRVEKWAIARSFKIYSLKGFEILLILLLKCI